MFRPVSCVLVVALAAALGGCKPAEEDEAPRPTTEEREPKLLLMPPGETTIRRGGTAKVVVRLERRNFTGPVVLDFEEMPPGVGVIEAHENKKVEGDESEVVLQALPDAELVRDHLVRVSARGPEGVKASEMFKLNVMR